MGLSIPGSRPVERLEWQETQELGFEELTADLGIKFTRDENDKVPRMGRVLMISDHDDEEEMQWLFEPAEVRSVGRERKRDEYRLEVSSVLISVFQVFG